MCRSTKFYLLGLPSARTLVFSHKPEKAQTNYITVQQTWYNCCERLAGAHFVFKFIYIDVTYVIQCLGVCYDLCACLYIAVVVIFAK